MEKKTEMKIGVDELKQMVEHKFNVEIIEIKSGKNGLRMYIKSFNYHYSIYHKY